MAMRGDLRVAALLAFVLGSLIPASAARADDFAEFRIPAHTVSSWTGQAGGEARRDASDDPRVRTRTGLVFASVAADASWLRDSDPTLVRVRATVSAGGDRRRIERVEEIPSPAGGGYLGQREDATRSLSEQWIASVDIRHYPWAVPVGISGAVFGRGTYLQSWFDIERSDRLTQPPNVFEDVSLSSSARRSAIHDLSTSIAIGWGRVRDASVVYELIVIERRLREAGALVRPPSRAARQRLVDLLHTRDRYGNIHDRPAAALWSAIGAILLEDGAVAAPGWTAGQTLRLAEPHFGPTASLGRDALPRSPIARQRGFFVGPTLANGHQRVVLTSEQASSIQSTWNDSIVGRTESRFEGRTARSADRILGGLVAEWHRPVGERWQLDAVGQATIPGGSDERWLTAFGRIAARWIVADRWLASGAVTHTWFDARRTDGPTPGDVARWDLAVNVRYYLTDRTAIELDASEIQQDERGDPNPAGPVDRFGRSGRIVLGVTHRFAGTFDLPGVPLE